MIFYYISSDIGNKNSSASGISASFSHFESWFILSDFASSVLSLMLFSLNFSYGQSCCTGFWLVFFLDFLPHCFHPENWPSSFSFWFSLMTQLVRFFSPFTFSTFVYDIPATMESFLFFLGEDPTFVDVQVSSFPLCFPLCLFWKAQAVFQSTPII